MKKVDQNKQQKLDALLNTSFDLFTRNGLAETTISNIVEKSGIAKGTFYLYFKDKYDLHSKLVVHKARQVFAAAFDALFKSGITDAEESVIFMTDNILNQFENDRILLNFVSKNLSWGIFKNELIHPTFINDDHELEFYHSQFLERSKEYDNPELLIYLIIEFISSSCYSPILYGEPVSLKEYKPYLFDTIRSMLRAHHVQ